MAALAPRDRTPHPAPLRRLPSALREDGVAIHAVQRPAPAESGDLLYVGRRSDGTYLVAVGDVMGCGPQAAPIAQLVEHHLETLSASSATLGEILESANDLVFAHCRGERFMSLLLLELDPERHAIQLASAGHPAPLAVGRAGRVIPVGGSAPALGLVRERDFHELGPLRLPRGVTLLVTTGGVLEARDREGDRFGRDRAGEVLAALAARGPRAVVEGLLEAAESHAVGPGDRSALALRFV